MGHTDDNKICVSKLPWITQLLVSIDESPVDDDVDDDDDDDNDDDDDDDDNDVLQLQLLVLYHELIRTNVLSNYGVTTYQNY